jgi:hypothetical protein
VLTFKGCYMTDLATWYKQDLCLLEYSECKKEVNEVVAHLPGCRRQCSNPSIDALSEIWYFQVNTTTCNTTF